MKKAFNGIFQRKKDQADEQQDVTMTGVPAQEPNSVTAPRGSDDQITDNKSLQYQVPAPKQSTSGIMNLASDVASIFLRRSSNAPPKPILRPFAGIENTTFVEAMRDYKKVNPMYEFKKGNYKFIAQLGKGSYAKVYSAQQIESGALVAVKEIDKTRMRHREERMKTEIEILIKLDHPNLLTLIDWGIGKANVYLVVELAQGGDLFDVIIDKGNFFEWEAAVVMNSLLNAIEYLHEKGIVHRDIKPENILVRDPKKRDFKSIVLADYGIARVLDDNKKYLQTRIGSSRYMAPEVLLQRPYGKPCDLWASGVILFILLSGTAPYRGRDGDYEGELEQILNVELDFKSGNWPDISKNAIDMVRNLMNLDPKRRMTAKEAKDHAWMRRYTARSASPTSAQQPARPTTPHINLFPGMREAIESERARMFQQLSRQNSGGSQASSQNSVASSGFAPRSSPATGKGSNANLPSFNIDQHLNFDQI